MKKIISLFMTVVFILSLNSCAVMFNGSKKSVNITSSTPASKIYVDGQLVGTETATVKLKRKQDHTIIVKKEGCKSQTVPLEKEFQIGWVFLYILLNPLAVITDAPSGAWYGFDKSHVVVPELDCEK